MLLGDFYLLVRVLGRSKANPVKVERRFYLPEPSPGALDESHERLLTLGYL